MPIGFNGTRQQRPRIFAFSTIQASRQRGCALSVNPMRTTRIISAFFAFMIGAVMLLVGLVLLFGHGANSTIEHNRQIEQSFRTASQYISTFKHEKGRMPTEPEFTEWAAAFPQKPYSSPHGMWLKVSFFPEEAIKRFGDPSKDSYLLGYWHGEWTDYYASWADRTSMEFDESKYYALGSKYADGALFVLIAVLAIIAGRKLWPILAEPAPKESTTSGYIEPGDGGSC